MSQRPASTEYNEYYGVYIDQVPEGDIVGILKDQKERIDDLMAQIPESKLDFRYEQGKWSVKEVIGHVIDTEWIFAYRALRMARNDSTALAGMDQNEFMEGANFGDRELRSLAAEFLHLRSATIELFSSFDESLRDRAGTASGFPFTVRSLMYITAGHAEHHMRILRERYL